MHAYSYPKSHRLLDIVEASTKVSSSAISCVHGTEQIYEVPLHDLLLYVLVELFEPRSSNLFHGSSPTLCIFHSLLLLRLHVPFYSSKPTQIPVLHDGLLQHIKNSLNYLLRRAFAFVQACWASIILELVKHPNFFVPLYEKVVGRIYWYGSRLFRAVISKKHTATRNSHSVVDVATTISRRSF